MNKVPLQGYDASVAGGSSIRIFREESSGTRLQARVLHPKPQTQNPESQTLNLAP